MKLFHKKGRKEVVYVQMQDIVYLSNETDISIPASIFTKVFTGPTIVNDSNRFNFVKFEEKSEVEFFRKIGFIIDYDKYKDLTEDELEKEMEKLSIEMNEIAHKWNLMRPNERMQNKNLLEEHRNKGYMLKFISEVYDIKRGKRAMPFPEFKKKCKKKKVE